MPVIETECSWSSSSSDEAALRILFGYRLWLYETKHNYEHNSPFRRNIYQSITTPLINSTLSLVHLLAISTLSPEQFHPICSCGHVATWVRPSFVSRACFIILIASQSKNTYFTTGEGSTIDLHNGWTCSHAYEHYY